MIHSVSLHLPLLNQCFPAVYKNQELCLFKLILLFYLLLILLNSGRGYYCHINLRLNITLQNKLWMYTFCISLFIPFLSLLFFFFKHNTAKFKLLTHKNLSERQGGLPGPLCCGMEVYSAPCIHTTLFYMFSLLMGLTALPTLVRIPGSGVVDGEGTILKWERFLLRLPFEVSTTYDLGVPADPETTPVRGSFFIQTLWPGWSGFFSFALCRVLYPSACFL